MADEITISASLKVSNGLLTSPRSVTRLQADQATQMSREGVQSIGTTYEAIDLGDVATAGYVYIRNIDTTNYVEIGTEVSAAFAPAIKLLAGEAALFRAGAVLYAKADTAAVKIDVLILDT